MHRQQIESAYKKKVEGLLRQVTVKTAADIQSDLDAQTPVDTGRARSNWLPSIGTPRSDTTENLSGSTEIASNYKLGQKIFITNNLPYIKRLNEGHSTQAPSGYVELTVQKRVNRLKEAVRSIKV